MALRIPYPRLPRPQTAQARFEAAVWPHLDAAFNLACYLTRNVEDAEDVVQDAVVRAYAAWGSYRGGESRAWFLTIVRNATYSHLRQRKNDPITVMEESLLYDVCDPSTLTPEASLIASVDRETLRQAVERLPIEFREALILREMEDLSYREIAEITGAPLGTVMSRLTRARRRLQTILRADFERDANDAM